MKQSNASDRRYVRVPFGGLVEYRVADEHEVEPEPSSSSFVPGSGPEQAAARACHPPDPDLVKFLLHLEDKMDRILEMLSPRPVVIPPGSCVPLGRQSLPRRRSGVTWAWLAGSRAGTPLAQGQRANGMAGSSWEHGTGVDISASGLRFTGPVPVSAGQKLMIRIRLFRYPLVMETVLGRVVWSRPVARPGPPRWEAAVAFCSQDDKTADVIMSYAFSVQRSAIRRRQPEQDKASFFA